MTNTAPKSGPTTKEILAAIEKKYPVNHASPTKLHSVDGVLGRELATMHVDDSVDPAAADIWRMCVCAV